MALDSYASLKTSVLSWLARPGDPLVEPAVPDMVKLFEAEANRRLRTVDAEKSATLAVNASGYAVLPADCWGVRRVSQGGVVLQYMAPGAAPFVTTAGESYFYTLLGANTGGLPGQSGTWTEFRLLLGPMVANQTGLVEVIYQVGVPPLGDTRPSNWLLTNHCDAYLWGALAEAELYIGHDERAPLWLQRRDAVFQSIEQFDRKTRWAGPMQIRVDGITTPSRGNNGAAGSAPPAVVIETAAVRVVNPISGTVVTMIAGERALYVEGGPRAALTIALPPNPAEDMLVEISFERPITALTMTYPGGLPLAEPSNAFGPGAGLQFRFVDEEWRYWK